MCIYDLVRTDNNRIFRDVFMDSACTVNMTMDSTIVN